MVRGAGCRAINLRIRRREKNVLDIPFYRSGDSAQNHGRECNGDVTTVEKTRAEPEDRNCARRLEILPSGSYRRVVADRSMLAAA